MRSAPPSAGSWTRHVATAAALVTLLDERWTAWVQLGLFGIAAGLNSGWASRCLGRFWRLLKLAFFLGAAPVFLLLVDSTRLGEEWLLVRIVYYTLLAGMLALPLVEFDSVRDLRRTTWVLAACFFISATYFQSRAFTLALLAAAFGLFHAFHTADNSVRPAPPARWAWRMAGFHFLLALSCGAVVFQLFPRVWFRSTRDANQSGSGDQVSEPIAGSRQMMEVGASSRRDQLQFANILDLSRSGIEVLTIRMVLEATGAPFWATNSLYLRASVFETYFDGKWRAHQPARVFRDTEDGARDGWTWVRAVDPHGAGPVVRQTIRMRPLDDFCFCLPEPLAINQPAINYEPQGILIFPQKATNTLDYQVISELPAASDAVAFAASSLHPRSIDLTSYLQVPSSLRPVLRRYYPHWNLATSPAQQAEQIRHYLQSQFQYGPTSFLPGEDTDPVRAFLTTSHRGYCTHFAAAMALLARSIGLPSRVATGYHFTGLPDADGSYHIRDLNAHAWTEVYLPARGWIIFDATPPGERPSGERPQTVRIWWTVVAVLGRIHDVVTEFNAADQKAFLAYADRLGQSVLALPIKWGSSLRAWLCLIGSGGLAWVLFRKLPLRHRRRILEGLSRTNTRCAVPFYADLLWMLARRGLAKPSAMTAQEYCAELNRRFPQPEIIRLTRQFYRVKYGGVTLSATELRDIEQELAQVEATLARRLT